MPPQRPDSHAIKSQIIGRRCSVFTFNRPNWRVGRWVNHLEQARRLQTSQGAGKFECVMPYARFGRCERQAIKSYAHFFVFHPPSSNLRAWFPLLSRQGYWVPVKQ